MSEPLMTTVEAFRSVLALAYADIGIELPPEPSSYDEVAQDVGDVRRIYAERGWLQTSYDDSDLDELCATYVATYDGRWSR